MQKMRGIENGLPFIAGLYGWIEGGKNIISRTLNRVT